MTRAYALSVLVALVAVALAGCTTRGTPVDPNGTGQLSSQGGASTSAAGGNRLHDLDPCSLLTPADEGQLGAANGRRADVSTARRCAWTVSGSYSFDIAVFEDKASKDLPIDKGRQTAVNFDHHHGQKLEENSGPGICTVTLDVTEHSSVSAGAKAGTNTAKACDVATQVANMIDSKLP